MLLAGGRLQLNESIVGSVDCTVLLTPSTLTIYVQHTENFLHFLMLFKEGGKGNKKKKELNSFLPRHVEV